MSATAPKRVECIGGGPDDGKYAPYGHREWRVAVAGSQKLPKSIFETGHLPLEPPVQRVHVYRYDGAHYVYQGIEER